MSFSVNTYSPSEVTLAFGGYVLTGWNTITLSRNTDTFTPVAGIRGKNTRIKNRNTAATIAFSCLQSGDANDLLTEIHRLDEVNGAARLAITLKDNSGTFLFHTNEGYITSYPDVTFSGQFEYRVWTIQCQSSDTYTVGGNATAQDSLFNQVKTYVGDTISGVF